MFGLFTLLPDSEKNRLKWLNSLSWSSFSINTILAGDWNTNLDIKSKISPNSSLFFLNQQISKLVLKDIWKLYGNGLGFTFRHRNNKYFSRIDSIYSSFHSVQKNKIKINHSSLSDHDMIVWSFEISSLDYGPGYWKLPSLFT